MVKSEDCEKIYIVFVVYEYKRIKLPDGWYDLRWTGRGIIIIREYLMSAKGTTGFYDEDGDYHETLFWGVELFTKSKEKARKKAQELLEYYNTHKYKPCREGAYIKFVPHDYDGFINIV